jgi:hypothetical protein
LVSRNSTARCFAPNAWHQLREVAHGVGLSCEKGIAGWLTVEFSESLLSWCTLPF